jgi:hypothetical protein
MKPEKVEKITRAGASVLVFVVFLLSMTAVTASSFGTNLRLFLS